MPNYSIAEAEGHLSRLVDEAVEGLPVALTNGGKVVAWTRPDAPPEGRRPSKEFIAALLAQANARPPLGEPAADIIRRMRDGQFD